MKNLQERMKLLSTLERLQKKTSNVKEVKAELLKEVIALSNTFDTDKLFEIFTNIVKIAGKGVRTCESIPLIEDQAKILRKVVESEACQ